MPYATPAAQTHYSRSHMRKQRCNKVRHSPQAQHMLGRKIKEYEAQT
jgi:hypothetical protein